MIRFVLNGVTYELHRHVVEDRLSRHAPESIQQYAVKVNDVWFPVKQALEVAIGVPRTEFISQTARRHLAKLGFEVSGGDGTASERPAKVKTAAPKRPTPTEGGWHTEENTQGTLVAWLVAEGWEIVSTANTATKERGIDVIARRGAETAGFEVKGYPGRGYADPRRADEKKRTSPTSQAGHWFSQATLAAMKLRTNEPSWTSAIALPAFPRYFDLYAKTRSSLDAAGITLFWVHEDGSVSPAD